MGILNVTPDSFADGGRYDAGAAAVQRLGTMAADGAAICDVGAESTRPGAASIDAATEMARLAPVITAMRDGVVDSPISIDTRHAIIAAALIDAGAVLVNDVSAGADPDMLPLVADRGAAICLMHMRGEPATMQDDPQYDDVVGEVLAFLEARLDAAVSAGVPHDRVLLDPGIGFGKSLHHNVALMAALPRIVALGCPVVVGASRKGVIGQLTGRQVDDRLPGSLGAALASVAGGASVVRVHDVAATVDALRVFTAMTSGGGA